jgi:hypothetical protein
MGIALAAVLAPHLDAVIEARRGCRPRAPQPPCSSLIEEVVMARLTLRGRVETNDNGTAGHLWWQAVAATLLALALAALAVDLLREPGRYGDVRVRNPSEYTIAIEVAAPHAASQPIGSIAPFAEATFYDILDPGPVWVLRLTAQGRTEETTVQRPDTTAPVGTIDVPADVISRFRAAGVPANPCIRNDCPPQHRSSPAAASGDTATKGGRS